jgi:hypothetical protein
MLEARSFFEDEVLSTMPSQPGPEGNKTPLWEQAKMVKVSLGDALVVPIKYEKPQGIKAEGEKTVLDLQKSSYLLIYKDKNKNMQAEWVRLAPMGEKKNDKFVGIILVHEWNGKAKHAFAFNQNGEIALMKETNVFFHKASMRNSVRCYNVNLTHVYSGRDENGGEYAIVTGYTITNCIIIRDFNFPSFQAPEGNEYDFGYGGGGGGGYNGLEGPYEYSDKMDCAGVPNGTAIFSEECQKCIGGTTGIEKCPSKNPCDESLKLTQDIKFKQLFTNLKNQVKDNKEHGYLFTKDANGKIANETSITGFANMREIEFNVNNKIDGYLHTHYKRLLPVFSFSDIKAMALIYKAGYMVNPETFTAGLVTAHGTQYLLFIEDINKFKTFADEITRPGVHDAYEYSYQLLGVSERSTIETNEKGLLSFFSSTKSGITLMKGNTKFDNWERKTLSNNNTIVQRNPCK